MLERVLDYVLPDEDSFGLVEAKASEIDADGHVLFGVRMIDKGKECAIVAVAFHRVGLHFRLRISLPVRAVACGDGRAVAHFVGGLKVWPAGNHIGVSQ